MYKEFYGMREKPFDLLPNPQFLYMSPGHDNAYTHLEYAISENKGFVVITGEVGCGKTTLINYLLHQVPADLHIGLISQTDVEPELFFKLICRKFEIGHEGLDKGEMIAVFQDFLIASRRNQKRVTLIIDEAQNLPDRTLEEIRMLSNLEAEKEHLIQIILVGQPELRQKLRRPHLRQFRQRVTVHYHLEGLKSLQEIREYIRHRLQVTGCPAYATLFSDAANAPVQAESQGVPRLINYICDMALVHGYAEGITTIDEKIIDSVRQARSQSSLFAEEDQESETTITSVTSEPENNSALTSTVNNLKKRLSFVESIVESQAHQLQEMNTALTTRDQLFTEIAPLMQKSLEKRWQTNLRYQRVLNELNNLKNRERNEAPLLAETKIKDCRSPLTIKKSLFQKLFCITKPDQSQKGL